MDVDIVQETCCNCGVLFWIEERHHKDLVKCKNLFYCPNGHSQSYCGQTKAQEQKERAEKAENQAHRLNCELKNQIQTSGALQRSNNSLRGVITHMKKKKSKNKS